MRPSKYGVLSEKAVEESVESVLRGSGESESYEGPARTRNRGGIVTILGGLLVLQMVVVVVVGVQSVLLELVAFSLEA